MNDTNKLSKNIDVNINNFNEKFSDCDDIIRRKMRLGSERKVDCMVVYVEVAVSNMMLSDSVIGKIINNMWDMPYEEIYEYIKNNGMGISDVSELEDMETIENALLSGNAVLFIDGYDKAIKISSKGYPSLGVTQTESEKAVRGSKESFSDSAKTNAALIRKRIKDSRLKVKEIKLGVRSNTLSYIVYMEDIVRPGLIDEIENSLDKFEIDGIFDTGMVEQITEKKWYSPFPQYQNTERPDFTAMALLEGRAVFLSDNSPSALLFPADCNSFLKASDDYYSHFEIVSLNRILRYIAVFLAMALPGFYIAVTNFHTQVLPTDLILSFAAAREGVPFPGIVEVLSMELAFELLREAGVRLPGAMGNTIGIVGGLIIGQAAVDANLVSPIVVIVVAATALCSFAIPNEEFATSFRILKFFFIIICAALGFYGFTIGILAVLIHLSHLESFKIPYLMPFASSELDDGAAAKDSIIRMPEFMLKKRPVYSNENQKIRLKIKK